MAGPKTISVLISEISIGDRIGFFHGDHAANLGASMEAEGQHTPIQIKLNGNAAKQKWTLVAGLHRLCGAKSIGWAEIAAIQVAEAGATAADLRRMELAENLGQKHRRPIERAIMMVEHARLEEAVDHPGAVGEASQVRAARKRWNSGEIDASVTVTDASHPADWRARTAAAFNTSLSQFERHQRIHRAIVCVMPDLAQALNDHPLGESFTAMGRLAKIKTPEARRIAAETLLSRPDWQSMDQVLVTSGLATSTGYRVPPRSQFIDAWSKWPLAERQAHAEWLAEKATPGMAKNMVARFKQRGLL